MQGRTGYEIVTGETPDISEFCDFHWYEPVWYFDEMVQFPDDKRQLGRWLGPAHRTGQALTYYVADNSGGVIARSTVQRVSEQEFKSDEFKIKLRELDETISRKYNEDWDWRESQDDILPLLFDKDDPDESLQDDGLDLDDLNSRKGKDAETEGLDLEDPTVYDKFIGARVRIARGDDFFTGTVKRRKRDEDGNLIGHEHENPILDSRMYEVEFLDGRVEQYTANLLAEAMYSRCNEEGHHILVLDEIIDHAKTKHAVEIDDADAAKKTRYTTKGWHFCAQWRNGTTSWHTLYDLKQTYPVEVAEYVINNKLASEPAFTWWVPYVMKKKDRIIAKIKSKYWERSHKYGIRIPKSVEEALAIDRANGNHYWRNAIEKEMGNNRVAFKILKENKVVPPGRTQIKCHMIFDVKFDFTRKARFVAGGHLTKPPSSITYSTVVTRDSVRIAFMIAALNDLDILAADIGNAYLNAPCREKVYFFAGTEFGTENKGRPVIIVRALYGLKSSGAAWHAFFATSLGDKEVGLGFSPCTRADPDVWIKEEVKSTGEKYYSYILVYVDDILVIHEDPKIYMDRINEMYCLKEGSVEPPTNYLGACIRKWDFDDGTSCWAMGARRYIKTATDKIEKDLENIGRRLIRNPATPFSSGYRVELDVSPELNPKSINKFQELLGILRWIVELGRVDVLFELTALSRFMVNPREGHLDQAYRIFAYLKCRMNAWIVLDPTYINIEYTRFKEVDWKPFYPDAKEELDPNDPTPLGRPVRMCTFVDTDHAGDKVTRRSYTGVMTFLNNVPIQWVCKRQNTVETSTFGSEFLALREATKMIIGLRYKLRAMGIPIDGPSSIFCDNNSVVISSTMPESRLKKKHNALAYHKVREAIAAGITQITHVSSGENIADLFTKSLVAAKRKALLYGLMFINGITDG